MGLSTDHPLFIDISYVSAVILVGDLPPKSASLLMCGIAKKVLHLFFSLQGSSNNNEIDHAYLTFLVSKIAIFMQITKGKNEKERLQQEECIQQKGTIF